MRTWRRMIRALVDRERDRSFLATTERLFNDAIAGDVTALELVLTGSAIAGSAEAASMRRAAFGPRKLPSAEDLERRVDSWLRERAE